jgi:hypothetical protein
MLIREIPVVEYRRWLASLTAPASSGVDLDAVSPD